MKLPINPLLYLASLACAGGIVLNIMGTLNPRIRWDRNEVELRNQVKTLMERGGKVLPDIGQWRYDPKNPFWEQFKTANFTGYRPPEVEVETDVKEDEGLVGASDVNLKEKITVVCISYGDDNTHTRVVVKYEDPNVQVPAHALPPPAGPGDVAQPAIPAGRGRGRRPSTAVVPQVTSTPLHPVRLEQHLWGPYQNFYLVAVADDARSVFFENRAKDKVGDKYPRQEVIKNELGLPEDVARKLVQEARRSASSPDRKATPEPKKAASQWQDLPKTKAIRENEWNVSRKDLDYINQRGNKFIHEDVSLGDYSGGTGKHKVQGVSVRKLGRRASGLGINEGDILISLNGIKVKNRAHAVREGKRLWRKGVRTFKAVFLRRGQEITITHHFPDK